MIFNIDTTTDFSVIFGFFHTMKTVLSVYKETIL